jgi:hypothetical protein
LRKFKAQVKGLKKKRKEAKILAHSKLGALGYIRGEIVVGAAF